MLVVSYVMYCVLCVMYFVSCIVCGMYYLSCVMHCVCVVSSERVTASALLHPLILPKIYPPLFNLYALYNERDDDQYWKRIRLWNKQSNLALMSYLGVDKSVADISQSVNQSVIF